MRIVRQLALPIFFTLSSLVFITSCSGPKDRLVVEGSFRGLNEGELYIYGTNGARKLDTVALHKGNFEYRIPLEDTVTFVLVFPNFSELPIFAEPGDEISVEGDATHLRETEIKGNKLNKQMTAWRLQTAQLTPPEVAKAAAEFITAEPASPISRYLFDRYFIRTAEPDYTQALELARVIQTACPDNQDLPRICRQLEGLRVRQKQLSIPAFTATDINGRRVSNADLRAKVNVITLWATWNYESVSIQNLLNRLSRKYGADLAILSVCIDANVRECRRIVGRDSVRWSNVCDGSMWESPILQGMGLTYLPDNILLDAQGRVIAQSLNYSKMTEKLAELLE